MLRLRFRIRMDQDGSCSGSCSRQNLRRRNACLTRCTYVLQYTLCILHTFLVLPSQLRLLLDYGLDYELNSLINEL
jgi:hypothetical protein